MQMIHDVYLKARIQLLYAMHPCTPDFLLFRPDSTYTEEDAGQFPWMLKQLETVLAAHSSQVASYLQSLAPEVLNICCSEDVRSALSGKKTAALLPGDTMDESLQGLLMRCSLNLRAVCREMILESADVFATHIESFCPQLRETEPADGVKVRCNSCGGFRMLFFAYLETWLAEHLVWCSLLMYAFVLFLTFGETLNDCVKFDSLLPAYMHKASS